MMRIRQQSSVAIVAWLLLVATPLRAAEPADGPPPNTMTAEELEREIKRRFEEIEAHETSPLAPAGWQELKKVEAALETLEQQEAQQQSTLRDRKHTLSNSPEVKKWKEASDKLEQRIWDLQREEYRLKRNAGQRLLEARHAELAKRSATPTPELRALGFDLLSFPHIDGSTSTQPLAVLIACRAFDAPYAWLGAEQALPKHSWTGFPADPAGFGLYFQDPEPELRLLEFTLQAKAAKLADQRRAIIINRLLATNASTHNAYVNLIEGRSDIGLLARAPSASELELARANHVELEAVPCALDALVFLVHESNAVRNLSTAQLRDIYSDKLLSWKAVGGAHEPITAYQREENSGSQELMQKLVMKEVPIFKPKSHLAPQLIGQLMSSVYLEITQNHQGLAYSVYYYERYMIGSPQTRTIAVDGIAPTDETIRNRKYPYTTEVLVVTRKDQDPQSPASRLRDWLLSPEGQAVVAESGYVPLGR